MFVQALAKYADRNLQEDLNDAAFERRPVPYFLEIGPDGIFLGARPRFDISDFPAKKGAKPKTTTRPQLLRAPRSPVNRNSGLYPLLGTDDIKYVLGVGAWTKPGEQANHAERHESFVALIHKVARETEDDALQACSRFYAQPAEIEKARLALAGAAPGINVALYRGGVLTERPVLQAWWRKAFEATVSGRASAEMAECLISGIIGPVPPTHPKIKHTAALGGQSAGVSLMSFDKGAFRSYGWEQCANSPVSADRAMAYVLALNHLLRPGERHRKDINGVAFIFWLRDQEDEDDPFSFVLQPKPEQVKDLLEFKRTADPDPNRFYMAALSANGSRLVLRSWVTDTLPAVKANLRNWFQNLRIQPRATDQEPKPPSFLQLRYAIEREGEPSAGRVVALLRRAIEGPRRPLGYRIVEDVITRMKVEPAKRLDLAALGLLRLCLNDLHHATSEGEPMSEALNPDLTHPAYLCGRLLALHEYLQWKTFETAGEAQPNSTVSDRFYNLVSVSPAIGLTKVFELGRKHVAKLRKLNAGAAFNFEQQIATIEEPLGGNIPKAFGMHDKARFALGFYHQRAFRPKKANEAAATEPTGISNLQEKESD